MTTRAPAMPAPPAEPSAAPPPAPTPPRPAGVLGRDAIAVLGVMVGLIVALTAVLIRTSFTEQQALELPAPEPGDVARR